MIKLYGKKKRGLTIELYQEQEGRCIYCGVSLKNWEDRCQDDDIGDCQVIDHIVAVCNGGSNNKDNLCLSCFRCNSSKGSKTIEDFLSYVRPLRFGIVSREELNDYNIYMKLRQKFEKRELLEVKEVS